MIESPAEKAHTWLRAWATHDLSLLRLAPDFVHTSPFGRIEGAEEYLRIVEPMSRKSVDFRGGWRHPGGERLLRQRHEPRRARHVTT